MTMTSFKLKNLQAFCYRYPLATPVVTSFGRMNDRPAVFVRVEDEDGELGWGEAWCNFPAVGADIGAGASVGRTGPVRASDRGHRYRAVGPVRAARQNAAVADAGRRFGP